jgi:hypothetical protein
MRMPVRLVAPGCAEICVQVTPPSVDSSRPMAPPPDPWPTTTLPKTELRLPGPAKMVLVLRGLMATDEIASDEKASVSGVHVGCASKRSLVTQTPPLTVPM